MATTNREIVKQAVEGWIERALDESLRSDRATLGSDSLVDHVLAALDAKAAVPGGHTNTTEDGQILDVDKLLNMAGRAMLAGRKVEYKLISDLKPVSDSRESGFSGLRYAIADYSFPALISPTKEVLDGRHRIIKARDDGQLTVPTLTLTNEEIQECVITEKNVPAPSPDAAARARAAAMQIVAKIDIYDKAEWDEEMIVQITNVIAAAFTAAEAEVTRWREDAIAALTAHKENIEAADMTWWSKDGVRHENELYVRTVAALQSLKGGKDK